MEAEIQRLASFLNSDPLDDRQIASLKSSVSVERMRMRYANLTFVKDHVDQGRRNVWKEKMTANYAETFDSLTKDYFAGDEIRDKFL